jgi:hypothetical protein
MSGKYLLGAGALGVSYLVYSYMTDESIMYEGERIFTYSTWLKLKYAEYMKLSPKEAKKLNIKVDGLSPKTFEKYNQGNMFPDA